MSVIVDLLRLWLAYRKGRNYTLLKEITKKVIIVGRSKMHFIHISPTTTSNHTVLYYSAIALLGILKEISSYHKKITLTSIL